MVGTSKKLSSNESDSCYIVKYNEHFNPNLTLFTRSDLGGGIGVRGMEKVTMKTC